LAREHISPQQLKHDPLMDQYLKTSAWVKPRTRQILMVLGAIAVLALLVWGYQWNARRTTENAGNAFLEALKIDGATVSDPLPPPQPGAYAFKTEDEKTRAAIAAFEKVGRDFPKYAEVAIYYAAVRQLKVDAAKGEEALKNLAEKSSTVSGQARLALAQRYEATGKYNEALAEYQKLKASPSDVPGDLIELNLARTYEAMGKTQEAADLYFAVASRNREKPTAVNTEALNRLTVLDPARVDKLPEVKKEENPTGTRMITQ
jgi:tetratricopeptide (TPR) repeat protein